MPYNSISHIKKVSAKKASQKGEWILLSVSHGLTCGYQLFLIVFYIDAIARDSPGSGNLSGLGS
jgi:hypothetical protein